MTAVAIQEDELDSAFETYKALNTSTMNVTACGFKSL
ncbi:hypothetical protein PR003_g3498 [Phytophthora rubi]|uniref:Uncharacterized protein n=1 Tax=Phytophthora rubi TaxID=129364 RepID=A0A6A4FVC3_9STRA|nr:hypothetical protein PR003_g3498 [Phytophthora rubi]